MTLTQKPIEQIQKKLNKDIMNYLEGIRPRFTKDYIQDDWNKQKEILYGLIAGESCFLNTIMENSPNYLEQASKGKLLDKCAQIEKGSRYLSESIEKLHESYLGYLAENHFNDPFHEIIPPARSNIKKRVESAWIAAHDTTDIQKPYANKMEYLSRTRDGSKSGKKNVVTGKGYLAEGSILLHQKRIFPADLNVYSHIEAGHKTGKVETWKNLKKLNKAGLREGFINVYDRGYDEASAMVAEVKEFGRDFIIRGTDKRSLAPAEGFWEYNASCKTQKERNQAFFPVRDFLDQAIKYQKHEDYSKFEIGWKKVVVQGRDFPRKPDDCIDVTLVSVRITDKKIQGIPEDLEQGKAEREIFFYTTLPVENIEDAIFIFFCYLKRWVVETFFRFLKQVFELEKLRLQKFIKTKNLGVLLCIASGYHYAKFNEFEKIEAQLKTDTPESVFKKGPRKRNDEDILREYLYYLYLNFCDQKNLTVNPDSYAKFLKAILLKEPWKNILKEEIVFYDTG